MPTIKLLRRYLHLYGARISFVAITVAYLVIQWNRILLIIAPSPDDDNLQYLLSKSISSGHWLGKYNDVTLAKGPIYPIWTALVHLMHIPLWLGENLLFIGACVAIIYALRRINPYKWLAVIIYGGLLFDPLITARAYRDAIAPAIILFIFAWLIGMFGLITKDNVNKNSPITKDLIIFSLFGIISLPSWWYLREDYFWVVPFVYIIIIFCLVYYLISIKWHIRKNVRSLIVVVAALFLPLASVNVVGFEISSLNKSHYGRFVVSDYSSSDFTDAYAALTRVDNNTTQPITVPVTKYMREQLYKNVQAFRKLEPCLDGAGGECEGFQNAGPNYYKYHDYEGGWFPFALRMAVQNAGYYKNAAIAAAYYTDLTKEVDLACNSHAPACHSASYIDLTPLPTRATIRPFIKNLVKTMWFVFLLQNNIGDGPYYTPSNITTPPQSVVAKYYDVRYATQKLGPAGTFRINTFRTIARIYSDVNPVLFTVSLIVFIISAIEFMRKRTSDDWRIILLGWTLLGAVCLRITLISYVDTVSFPSISAMYLGSAYPLMFLFEGFALILILNRLTSHKPKN